MLAHKQIAQIFGTRGHEQNRWKAASKCWCWMALGWPRDLKVTTTRRMSQQKKRSAKRVGI